MSKRVSRAQLELAVLRVQSSRAYARTPVHTHECIDQLVELLGLPVTRDPQEARDLYQKAYIEDIVRKASL